MATISEIAALAALGGAPSPEVLAAVPSPSGDLTITETGGVIDNGGFLGWIIDGFANMGDVGGGQTEIEEHSGGYTELCCLNTSWQCRFWQNASGVPWPKNGVSAQDGVFLRYPKRLVGDFDLSCSISHGHPGHSLFGNGGIGLVARRPSDPNNYTLDSRVFIGASLSPTNSNWKPRVMGPKQVSGTGTGSISNTTRTWLRMTREAELMRFFWKASAPASWTELDGPGLEWDVAGSECEVGIGFGAHVEKNVIRIYDFDITGIEAA